MIEIDGSPSATDYWYNGTYTEGEREYWFTIYNPDGGDGNTVTWDGEAPENNEKIEGEILHKFAQT